MKWTRDNSGRFRQRPHYLNDELEQICEDAICSFLRDRHGKARFPVSTADLTVLVEKAVDDLDSGCDLEDGIDGLTDFFPRKKPKVKIASRLQQPHLENRLRTTLTHEYGHVILHGFLFVLDDNLNKSTEVLQNCVVEILKTSPEYAKTKLLRVEIDEAEFKLNFRAL